jgi:NADP-dependent 3-hydroxy acid dehydrogenase YdfG
VQVPGDERVREEQTRPAAMSAGAKSRSALITGASAGLGKAIAAALAPTHTLFLAGRPSRRLDEVAELYGATTWPIDLADTGDVETVVEPIAELDVLVHNAGVAYPGRVAETVPEQWRATLEVNVVGAVALTLALLPALRAARGHVVFINSGSGINASPGLASYSASKFALRGFADSLRNDERSLRVTSVHPGRIATVMQEGLVAYEGGDYDPSRFLQPETVAKVVADAVNAPPDAHIHEVIVRTR